jgi:hypothetical protein
MQHALPRFRALLAMTVAFSMLASVSGAGQQPVTQNGTLAGDATDEANQPYSNYQVRALDIALAQITETATLAADGTFSLTGLTVPRNYMLELFDGNRVVCTEGPFVLSPQTTERLGIDIDCGVPPVAWWLLGAAGAAGTAAVAVQSNAQ